jgi:hypothetical protein
MELTTLLTQSKTMSMKSLNQLWVRSYLIILENESCFIENLLTPIRRNPLEILFIIQNTEIGSFERFEFELQPYPILSVDLYLEIERLREVKAIIIISQEKDKEKEEGLQNTNDSLLMECDHIYNKVLFDCINEILDKYRYGN